MNDDDLLASAYLDDELDSADRARVEADRALMELVADYRRLRATLADVETPDPQQRDRAISAALADMPSGVVRSSRPRMLPRLLTAAAAVLGLGVFGLVVAQQGGGDDTDDASFAVTLADADVADMAAAEVDDSGADEARSMTEAVGAAPEASGVPPDVGAGATAAEATDVLGGADVVAAADDTMYAQSDAIGESTGSADASGDVSEESTFASTDARVPLPRELGAIAAELIAAREAGTLGSTPNTVCVIEGTEILDEREFGDGGATVAVLVAVSADERLAYGLDASTCAVLVVGTID